MMNINVQFSDAVNKEFSFQNIEALLNFCNEEKEFWTDARKKISTHNPISNYINISNTFDTVINSLNEIKSTEDEARKIQLLNTLKTSHFNEFFKKFIYSKHSFVDVWINSYEISIDTGNAFIEAITKNKTTNDQNFNSLKGYILAYEYVLQDESALTKRRNSERKSFEQIRKQLEDKKNSLISEVDDFEKNITNWQEKQTKYNNKLSQVKKKLFIRKTKREKKVFDAFIDNSKSTLKTLEETYHEKLRLEAPSKYWNKKASSYKIQGIIWSIILGIFLFVGMLELSNYFSLWLKAEQSEFKLNSLQGAVIFMTIITIYAILIQSISKMVFSSFHLQRDAEEREQLTLVYLSLTNESGNIDEDSRKIILQSLFSRADSGLLHKDSSPTMPGLGELLKSTKPNS